MNSDSLALGVRDWTHCAQDRPVMERSSSIGLNQMVVVPDIGVLYFLFNYLFIFLFNGNINRESSPTEYKFMNLCTNKNIKSILTNIKTK
jgi:hypothetical protein